MDQKMIVALLSCMIVSLVNCKINASYNQPKLNSSATWNQRGLTVKQFSLDRTGTAALFVDTNNTVYAASRDASPIPTFCNGYIHKWPNGNISAETMISSSNMDDVQSLFVTENGDIYTYDYTVGIPVMGPEKHEVLQWSLSACEIIGFLVMDVTGNCYGLFIDLNNTLYCSVQSKHTVLKKSLLTNKILPHIGDGKSGKNLYQLNQPQGIFVDDIFTLYVADKSNNRIQYVPAGQVTGITKAGSGAPGTIQLKMPTSVVLDGNTYLFIVDSGNNRIIGEGPDGFRCIIGSSCSSGSSSNRLINPQTMSFDSCGNIYVIDSYNTRIQKFLLSNSACDTSVKTAVTTQCPSTTTTTIATKTKTTTTISMTKSPFSTTTASTMTAITTISMQETPHVSVNTKESTSTTPLKTDRTTSRVKDIEANISMVTETTLNSKSQSILTTSSSLKNTTSSVHYNTTTVTRSTQQIRDVFHPNMCQNPERIGRSCNVNGTHCDLLEPCQNNGTCINSKTRKAGYICQCLHGFNGSRCEIDIRPCKPKTCWNGGTCVNKSETEFECNCTEGWTDTHCQTKINYCQNVTCHNNAICRPLFRDYRCECLTDSYSGRHCQIVARSLTIRKYVSKSFAYIAIMCILSAILFIIIMDLLKYGFRIDPVRNERERLRRRYYEKKKKKRVVAVRFIYVNAPTIESNTTNTPIRAETIV